MAHNFADSNYVKAAYRRRDEVATHVIAALNEHTTLHPEQADFNYDDGRVELLLCLSGVLPVSLRGFVYNCPLSIWLPLKYPVQPPIVLIQPTSTMQIKGGKYVDRNGKVSGPYLDDWGKKGEGCSLIPLIENLIQLFGQEYPLVSVSAAAATPTKPPPPPSPPSHHPSSSFSAAGPSQPPLPPRMFPSGRSGPLTSHDRSNSVGSGISDGSGPPPPPRPPIPPHLNGGSPQSPQGYRQHNTPPPPPPPPVGGPAGGFGPPQPPSYAQSPPISRQLDYSGSPASSSFAPRAPQPPYASPTPPTFPPGPPQPSSHFQQQQYEGHPGRPLSQSFGQPPQHPSQAQSPPFPTATHGSAAPPPPVPPHFQQLSQQHHYSQRPPQQHVYANGSPAHSQPYAPTSRPPPPPAAARAINILDDDEVTSPVAASSGVAPPPLPPNPELLALRARVHAKLSHSLSVLSAQTETDIQNLDIMASDLAKGEPAILDEMQRLEAVKDVCGNVKGRYADVVRQAEVRLAEYEAMGEGPEVDEIVCSNTIVYNQLLELVAEDAALEDTIYHLGRALNSDTANIDLDRFLKRVRGLAREQFLKRATINKALALLSSRR